MHLQHPIQYDTIRYRTVRKFDGKLKSTNIITLITSHDDEVIFGGPPLIITLGLGPQANSKSTNTDN